MKNHLTRRQALALGGATVLSGVAASCTREESASPAARSPHQRHAPAQPARPKNIIMLVSDGMSSGVIALAEYFSQITRQRGTQWAELMRDPAATHGQLDAQTAVSLVTDSAAAASAWGCGHRVKNGSLNVQHETQKPFIPILQTLKNAGRRTGLVTTDRVTGATPAGFATVSPRRNAYDAIAPQFLDRVDLLLGGGRLNFDPLLRPDRNDLIGDYQQAGYQFISTRSEILAAAPIQRALGLFADTVLPYSIDHARDHQARQTVPTLAEMTRFALRNLTDSPDGFFLMVEGARVDHAAHANDIAALLWDQLAFDDAVAEARRWTANRDDTLLLVLTDHGNANPGLNGIGPGYTGSTESFTRLASFTASFERLSRLAKTDPEQINTLLAQHSGLALDDDERSRITTHLIENLPADDLHQQDRPWVASLGQIFANHTGVAFTGVTHTADYNPLTAIGPAAETFTGLRHHTDLYHQFLALADLPDPNRLTTDTPNNKAATTSPIKPKPQAGQ